MAEAEQERARCSQCGDRLHLIEKLTYARAGKAVRIFECDRCRKIVWDD